MGWKSGRGVVEENYNTTCLVGRKEEGKENRIEKKKKRCSGIHKFNPFRSGWKTNIYLIITKITFLFLFLKSNNIYIYI